MSDSKQKMVLDSALKAHIAASDTAWWLKGSTTFNSEFSARFGNLPEDQSDALVEARPDANREALLQIDLATQHSAYTAEGVDRVEQRIEEPHDLLTSVIKSGDPKRAGLLHEAMRGLAELYL